MWVDLDGSKFNIDHAFALRPVGKHGKQCTLFSAGADPVAGGFLIDMPFESVFEIIQSARLIEIADMLPTDTNDDEAVTVTVTDPDPD